MNRIVATVAILALALMTLGCETSRPATLPPATSPARVAPPASVATPTASPTPTQVIGTFIDGVPVSLDGDPVFMGDALRDEIDNRVDSTPFLAGGWFRSGERRRRFCVFYVPPAKFDLCGRGFELHYARTGPWHLQLSMGRPPLLDPDLPYAADRAVVLRIHTHDQDCTPQVVAMLERCPRTPVLDGVAWLGEVETEPAVPTARPSEPADGLTRREAIDLARTHVGTVPGQALRLICAELRQYSEVEGKVAADRDPWLWVVVFRRGEFDWNRVGIQYRTGKLLVGEFHYGSDSDPMSC